MPEAPLEIRGFSHVCVRVSDLTRSLAFYRDGLGLRVIFDVSLDGPDLAAVTAGGGARGRMVGCLVPGSRVTVELLQLPAPAEPHARSRHATGYTNISLAVSDLDQAYRVAEARGLRPLQRPVPGAAGD
jgi:catechol 2,3-dioxygenase-like lactoylglutathione lyase family enzyme